MKPLPSGSHRRGVGGEGGRRKEKEKEKIKAVNVLQLNIHILSKINNAISIAKT
jgi:hypothetical protein